MTRKGIEVTLDKQGNATKFDFHGYEGPSCKDAAADILRILKEECGLDIEYDINQVKPEMNTLTNENKNTSHRTLQS